MTNLLFYLTFSVLTNWSSWDNGGEHEHARWHFDQAVACRHADHGYDLGDIKSNVVAHVVYGGVTNEFVVESKVMGFIRRDWSIKTERQWTTNTYIPATNGTMEVATVMGRPELINVWRLGGVLTKSVGITTNSWYWGATNSVK